MEDGFYYIVMDLYNNKDLFHFLSAYIQTNTKIKEVLIWDILNQSLDALVYLHNKGLIHRDIKLANIFMNDTGKVVIGDFGHCAVMKDKDLINYSPFPEEQEILKFYYMDVGTPNFKAPEISSGYYDQKVDVYALGVCLYCLCCHCLPHTDNLQTIQQDNYYSYDLRSMIYNMLIADPTKRPNSSDLYQIYKQKYINKYVANTSIHSVIQCLFNYQNVLEYFSNPFKIDYILETGDKKEVSLCLLGIKNNLDNKVKLEESCYVLRKFINRENKIKDSIEMTPSKIINIILIILYNELNEILPEQMEFQNSGLFQSQIANHCNNKNFNEFVNFNNKKFRSLISENFSGVLKKTYTCANCKYEFILFEKYNFINFNLNNYAEITKNNSVNLIDILIYYNNKQIILDDKNKNISCKSCKVPNAVNHYLNRQFFCFPKNLIITFEREQNNNNIYVDFDEKIYLNEQKDPNTSYEYYLTGIICELSSLNNGIPKYGCFVKRNMNWIYCDNKSNDSGTIATLSFIKKYRKIVSLFYYCDIKNSFSYLVDNTNFNNNMNFNNLKFFSNMNNQVNQFIFSNMFNNINYNNINNNFNLQMMNQNPMNNINNNFENNNDNSNNFGIKKFNSDNNINFINNLNQNYALNNNMNNNNNFDNNIHFNKRFSSNDINNLGNNINNKNDFRYSFDVNNFQFGNLINNMNNLNINDNNNI